MGEDEDRDGVLTVVIDSTRRDADTITIASEITTYRFENNRRYHAYRDGEYWYVDPPFALYPPLYLCSTPL
jgi:hypothetical protein